MFTFSQNTCSRSAEYAKGIYLETGGQKCPRCQSMQIEGGKVEIGSKKATQKVWCNDCDATWTDYHTMSNVEIG